MGKSCQCIIHMISFFFFFWGYYHLMARLCSLIFTCDSWLKQISFTSWEINNLDVLYIIIIFYLSHNFVVMICTGGVFILLLTFDQDYHFLCDGGFIYFDQFLTLWTFHHAIFTLRRYVRSEITAKNHLNVGHELVVPWFGL